MPLETPVTNCGNPYRIMELPRETGRNQVLLGIAERATLPRGSIVIIKRILI